MRNAVLLFIAVGLVAALLLWQGVSHAQQASTATLRSLSTFEDVPVSLSLKALNYHIGGLAGDGQGDPRTGVTGRPDSAIINDGELIFEPHGTGVTILDTGYVTVRYEGRQRVVPVDHVSLEDGREAWVEAIYVFP